MRQNVNQIAKTKSRFFGRSVAFLGRRNAERQAAVTIWMFFKRFYTNA
jgi:hypothetical protein